MLQFGWIYYIVTLAIETGTVHSLHLLAYYLDRWLLVEWCTKWNLLFHTFGEQDGGTGIT